MQRRTFLTSSAVAAFAAAISFNGQAWADADPLLSKSWEDIVAQAKQEGELVWFNWFFQDRFRDLVKPFTDQYGIKVTVPDSTYDGNFAKLLADAGRSEGDIDAISLGGDQVNKFDVTKYLVGPLTNLPNYGKLRTVINGGDSKGYAIAYWGNQTGFAYDPDKIKEADLPQTWADIDAFVQAHPMQFAFNDLRKGGAGGAFVQLVVRSLCSKAEIDAKDFSKAWTWLNANKDKYGFTASNADSLTRLSGGEFSIVSAWEDHLGGLQKSGEVDKRLKFYIPRVGMPGGGNVVGVPANAKHKAAALLFVSWLSSADTQIMFNEKMSTAPVNADAAGKGTSSVSAEMRSYAVDWFPTAVQSAEQADYLAKVVLQ